MHTPPKPKAEIWTYTQRKALLGLCIVVLGYLVVEAWRQPIYLSDPPAGTSVRGNQIQDRMDPNTADAAALSAIPNLGEARAQEIVDYRNTFARQHPGTPAFKSCADFMRVKGIGPGIAADLQPFLIFTDNAGAATR